MREDTRLWQRKLEHERDGSRARVADLEGELADIDIALDTVCPGRTSETRAEVILETAQASAEALAEWYAWAREKLGFADGDDAEDHYLRVKLDAREAIAILERERVETIDEDSDEGRVYGDAPHSRYIVDDVIRLFDPSSAPYQMALHLRELLDERKAIEALADSGRLSRDDARALMEVLN
jgi:hypothetical protein